MFTLRHHDPERYLSPGTNRVPPHVRRALRAEWEGEKAVEESARAAASDARATSARDWFEAKLAEMHKRLAGPDCPCCQPGYVAEEDDDPEAEAEPVPPAAPHDPAAPLHDRPPGIGVRADRHRWRAQTALARAMGADTSGTDPRDAEAAAFEEWQARMDGGLIGKGDKSDR